MALYRVMKGADAWEYEGKGHYNCKATRLHTFDDFEGGKLTMGLTHFFPAKDGQPGGGAYVRQAAFEMIYYVKKGNLTIITADEETDDPAKMTRHDLVEGDSIRFMPGACRGIDNVSDEIVQMLVVMIVEKH